MIVVRQIPLYWGIEQDPKDRFFLTGSWFFEDILPFRQSTWGLRIRVSHRHWLHIGRFRYRREALHMGLSYRPVEIGKWGTDAETAEEHPEDAVESGEAGEDADWRLGTLTGDIPVKDSGVVPGDVTWGDRQGVVASGDEDQRDPGAGGHPGVTTPS